MQLELLSQEMMRRARIIEGRARRKQRLEAQSTRLFKRAADLFRAGRKREALITVRLAHRIKRGI